MFIVVQTTAPGGCTHATDRLSVAMEKSPLMARCRSSLVAR